MSDPLVRLGLVLGVLMASFAVAALVRRRARLEPGSVHPTNLAPGVYLFSSHDCVDCPKARRELQEALAGGSFVEIGWEESPSTFRALGVDVVPTTVIVDHDGSAILNPGVPAAVIRRLSP